MLARVFHAQHSRTAAFPEKPPAGSPRPGKPRTDLTLKNADKQAKPTNTQSNFWTLRGRMWKRSSRHISPTDNKDRKVHPVKAQLVEQDPSVPTPLSLMNSETAELQRRQTIKQACYSTFPNAGQIQAVSHSHRIALQHLNLASKVVPDSGYFATFRQARTPTQPMQQSNNLVKSVSDTAVFRKYGALQGIIGKGACGTVHLALKSDPKGTCTLLFAIKKYHQPHSFETEKQYVNRLMNEFHISSALHHVNVVKTIDLVQDKARGWCEVMEYCPGGDLYALLHGGALVPSEADCYFAQIVNGVAYLHSMGIAHRDIKPEKLLLDASGCIKITDFGNSEVFRTVWEKNMHSAGGLRGNMEYVSPEELLEETFDPRCADIWASGIVYIAMTYARIPWKSATIDDPSYSRYRTHRAHQRIDSLKRTVESRNSIHLPHSHSTRPECPLRSNSTPTGQTDCGPGFAMIASLPLMSRLLMFRILDPDPKTRNTIEDVLCSSWVLGIETCHPSVVPASYAESVRRVREERARNEAEDAQTGRLRNEGNDLPIPDRFAGQPLVEQIRSAVTETGGKSKEGNDTLHQQRK